MSDYFYDANGEFLGSVSWARDPGGPYDPEKRAAERARQLAFGPALIAAISGLLERHPQARVLPFPKRHSRKFGRIKHAPTSSPR